MHRLVIVPAKRLKPPQRLATLNQRAKHANYNIFIKRSKVRHTFLPEGISFEDLILTMLCSLIIIVKKFFGDFNLEFLIFWQDLISSFWPVQLIISYGMQCACE